MKHEWSIHLCDGLLTILKAKRSSCLQGEDEVTTVIQHIAAICAAAKGKIVLERCGSMKSINDIRTSIVH